ncbi:MAG: hypothetical protein Q9198_009562, partial [Flavoplaca austrocitrina]
MLLRKVVKDGWAVEKVEPITITRLDGTPIEAWTPPSWTTIPTEDTGAKNAEPKQVMKQIVYDGIPPIAASDHFLDVDEGATMLAYGRMNDHRQSLINCKNLKKAVSKVALDIIGQGKEAMTLAHLSLKALAYAENQPRRPRLAEHQYLSIEFYVEGEER